MTLTIDSSILAKPPYLSEKQINDVISDAGVVLIDSGKAENYRRYDIESVKAVQSKFPDLNWCTEEPTSNVILIDRFGYFWKYDGSDPDYDNEGNGWRQYVHTLVGSDGRFITTPCPEEWDQVLFSGPMRVFNEELDGTPIHKFLYWREWKDGTGVGDPVVLTSVPQKRA